MRYGKSPALRKLHKSRKPPERERSTRLVYINGEKDCVDLLRNTLSYSLPISIRHRQQNLWSCNLLTYFKSQALRALHIVRALARSNCNNLTSSSIQSFHIRCAYRVMCWALLSPMNGTNSWVHWLANHRQHHALNFEGRQILWDTRRAMTCHRKHHNMSD
jgi:hypothetical protein